MQYSFTAITLALLVTAINASPIQLQSRDMIAISHPNAVNSTALTPPTPPAPPASSTALAPPAPQANIVPPISASITDAPPLANSTKSSNTTGTVFPGTAANCTKFFIVSQGDTCDLIDAKTGITLDVLRKLNTEIDPGCANLSVGQAVCVKN